MYKYQNVSDTKQTLVQEGNISPRNVDPQAIVLSDVAIENPNFKYIGEETAQSGGIVGVAERQENAVTEAQLQENVNQSTEEA